MSYAYLRAVFSYIYFNTVHMNHKDYFREGLRAFLAIGMIAILTACGDDDSLAPEEQAYIDENKAFIWEKKTARDANGDPLYTPIVALGDTALYRVTHKEGEWESLPVASSTVHVLDLEGRLIDGTIFQSLIDSAQFQMTSLIPGLTAILYRVHPDEKIEAIIPASLGYGSNDYLGIPGGSTLVFTFTLDKIL